MDVKEATSMARIYVTEVFADEEISQLGLEEVMYDHKQDRWRITMGFLIAKSAEIVVASGQTDANPSFQPLGLTDAALLDAAVSFTLWARTAPFPRSAPARTATGTAHPAPEWRGTPRCTP